MNKKGKEVPCVRVGNSLKEIKNHSEAMEMAGILMVKNGRKNVRSWKSFSKGIIKQAGKLPGFELERWNNDDVRMMTERIICNVCTVNLQGPQAG